MARKIVMREKMIKKSQIFNFDAYSDFSKLLYGKNFDFPLNTKTIKDVKNKNEARVITMGNIHYLAP